MKKLNIAAFGPHPDDIELLCAGTLAKYAGLGHRIHMVIATNGAAGDVRIPPAKLAAIREKEARQAAAVVGAELIWLGVDDQFLLDDRATRLMIVDAIRQCEADILLTASPEDYHCDHRTASKLVNDMSITAALPAIATEHKALSEIPVVYYYDTINGIRFLPEEYVDVTDQMDVKIQMLSCHASQLESMKEMLKLDLIESMKTNARYRGQQCGVQYAECFRAARGYTMLRPARILP
jgi:LmbE family N-acetylglucosaminyl deacetylase